MAKDLERAEFRKKLLQARKDNVQKEILARQRKRIEERNKELKKEKIVDLALYIFELLDEAVRITKKSHSTCDYRVAKNVDSKITFVVLLQKQKTVGNLCIDVFAHEVRVYRANFFSIRSIDDAVYHSEKPRELFYDLLAVAKNKQSIANVLAEYIGRFV